jgi:hypothetical protein
MHTPLMLKPRARVSWSAPERAEWLRLFDQSGQTAAEFCRDNDLSPATLSFWRQQLPEADAHGSALVEIPRDTLSLSQPKSSAAAVSMTLPSGLRFEVPVGLDMAWFGQLLQALVDAKA